MTIRANEPTRYETTCSRCGGHVPKPIMPLSVDAFVAYGKYAEELHRHCEEAEEAVMERVARRRRR